MEKFCGAEYIVVMLHVRKVTLMEDSDQNVHLKNLSSHQAGNEEEALNLLFLGDTNRMIAEVTDDKYVHLSVCLSICLSVCLFVCLSVCYLL